MSVEDGQIIGRSRLAFRNYQRRGCGSTPGVCGFSRKERGVLGGLLTYCNLHAAEQKPIQTVEETSGELKTEVVPEIYCGAGEEKIAVS